MEEEDKISEGEEKHPFSSTDRFASIYMKIYHNYTTTTKFFSCESQTSDEGKEEESSIINSKENCNICN